MPKRIGQADHRVRRHIEIELHARGGHLRAARAEEARGQGGQARLIIGGGNGGSLGVLLAKGVHQFRRQRVAAGFARDQHETPGPHVFTSAFPAGARDGKEVLLGRSMLP